MEQRWIWKGKIGLARFRCLKLPFKGCRTQTDFFFCITKLFLSWEIFDDFPPWHWKKKKSYFWLFPSSRFRKLVDFQKPLRVPVSFIDSHPKRQKCPYRGVSNENGSGHQALWQMSLASMLGVAGREGCGEPQRLPRICHPQLLLALAE